MSRPVVRGEEFTALAKQKKIEIIVFTENNQAICLFNYRASCSQIELSLLIAIMKMYPDGETIFRTGGFTSHIPVAKGSNNAAWMNHKRVGENKILKVLNDL